VKPIIPAEVLKHHTAVVGKTGSGKTSTEKLLVEQVVEAGARVCVLDTQKSDWWGITSSASGKSAGLPFKILGGPRGHVALHSSAGKVIGQLVGTGKLPLSIVDMADFEPGGIQRFFVDFATALWKHSKGVVYIVIEEAHELAPKERAGFGAENMAIHWAKKLATGGRTKGIKLIVATQRVQALHNAVLGSCETLIAHRLTLEADQTPVLNWLKSASKAKATEVAPTLASLPTGTGWICSGEAMIFEKVAFPKFKTYDNTSTPDGNAAEIEVKTAPVNQDELKGLIGEEAKKAESDDPKKLRERIAILERQTLAKPVVAEARPSAEDLAAAERRGFKAGFDEAINQASQHIRSVNVAAKLALEDSRRAIEAILSHAFTPSISISDIPSGSPAASKPALAPTRAPAAPVTSKSSAASGDGTLTNPQRTLLRSLAWWRAMGHDNPSRPQVAAIAGWKVTAGHLRNVIGSLNASGHTISKDGHVALTDLGAAAAPEPDMGVTLVAGLRGVLTNPQRQIFDCLYENRRGHPSLSRSDIAAMVGWDPNAGHLRNVIGSMRTLEIIEYPSNGVVQLQSWVTG